MDKRKLYIIFTIIIVALLPSAVFASVIIDQSYGVSTTTTGNPIKLIEGPNYATAHSLGFTNLAYKTSATDTANTITFGYVANDTSVTLVCVLEVKDINASKAIVDLSVNADSIEVTFYYSAVNTTITNNFPSATDLGTAITTSATSISMGTGSIVYISAVITEPNASATLNMDYSIS